MRVLVACEESQEVCKAFRARGHEAYSCDLQDCSGGHPEWHIQGDVLPMIYALGVFRTQDGEFHFQDSQWDLIIAHPPCTDLAASGARWFPEKQKDFRQQKSVVFFMQMALAHCKRVAVENPIGIMSSCYRKPDQIIQPYQFGHHIRKATCLWLRGLPKLKPTEIVDPGEIDENGFTVGGRFKPPETKTARSFRGTIQEQQRSGRRPFPALQRRWQNNGDENLLAMWAERGG